METQKLFETLHPLEHKVLPFVKTNTSLQELVEKTGLLEIEVMRALQWLSNKKLITIFEKTRQTIELGENGKLYRKKGLPETRLLKALNTTLQSAKSLIPHIGLTENEMSSCLGVLRRKGAIIMEKKEGDLCLSLTEAGILLQKSVLPEQQFLDLVLEPKDVGELSHYKSVIADLLRRLDIVRENVKKFRSASLTEDGKILQKHSSTSGPVSDRLTSEMLREGTWKDAAFRRYDVTINVPAISGGKRHPENQAIEYIRRIWLELGFVEMKGEHVATSFWDLDCLFVPQDHPARDMQDTFYVKGKQGVAKGSIPNKKLLTAIKNVHENGGDTGSRGWGGVWSEERAKEILLRTHTTVLSAKTISQLTKKDLPVKFFSIGKVFRNEALDWKHLFEFYQVEGIVVDPDANLSHLFGYLKEFYTKMGFSDVRLRPSHFPYTEPSLEVDVYHPVRKQWIELGGAGIFRPEVVRPLLGFDCPVLAWGQGMARIISDYWKIEDIRDVYRNDVEQLRTMKHWMLM